MSLMALTVLELEGGAVSAFAFVHGGIAALRSRALRPHRDARQLIALVTSPPSQNNHEEPLTRDVPSSIAVSRRTGAGVGPEGAW